MGLGLVVVLGLGFGWAHRHREESAEARVVAGHGGLRRVLGEARVTLGLEHERVTLARRVEDQGEARGLRVVSRVVSREL